MAQPRELRINLPTPFTGIRSKLPTFLQDCNVYLGINRNIYTDDEKKVAFVLSYMTEGDALTWKEQFIRQRTNNAGVIDLGTWINFLQDLEASFKEEDQVGNALYQLNHLKQGNTTAEEHNTNFKLLLGKAKIVSDPTNQTNQSVIIDYYKRTLNPRLVTKILSGETIPQTIEQWYSKAITLDNNYRQTLLLLGRAPPSKNRPFRQFFNPPRQRDPNAMDIDGLSLEERNECMRRGLCFYCKETGHRALSCPRKQNRKQGSSNSRNQPQFQNRNNQKKKGKDLFQHIRNMIGELDEEESKELFDLAQENGGF